MPAALPLTSLISQSSTRRRTYKTLRAQFGNGYAQTAPDGINNVMDVWEVTYENLTQSERDSLITVLDTVQGWDVLTWQAPGDATTKKWRVTPDGWSESTTGTLWTVSFSLEQTY